ncbi:MAG: methyl-accepting chemotaxis protein [Planctomycetota bacterium]|nr:methyl-accepting chemotaxis protein [Planctomycetota bacterium]
MWLSLRRRIFLAYSGINWFLSILVTWAFVLSLNLQDVEQEMLVLSVYLVLFGVKQLYLFFEFNRYLYLFKSGVDPEDKEKLERSLERLYPLPDVFALRITVLWCVKYVVLALILYFGFAEELDLGWNIIPVTMLTVLSVFFGSFAFNTPALALAVEPATAQLSIQAFRRNVLPAQEKRRVFRKILKYNVSIFVATACWLILIFFKAYDETRLRYSEQQAQNRLQELLLNAPIESANSLEGWSKQANASLDIQNDTVFVLGPEKKILVGANTVSWLESQGLLDSLRRKLDARGKGSLVVRHEDKAVAFRETSESYCVGLVHSGFDLAFAEVFLLLFVFGLALFVFSVLCSIFFARSLSGPVGYMQKLCLDLQEHGQIDRAEFLPVVEKDELGELVTAFNLLLQNFKDLSSFAREIAEGRLGVEIRGEGDLQTSFRLMAMSLQETVQDISKGSLSLSMIGTRLLASSQAMTEASGDQSRAMDEVSIVMDELTKGIEHVSQSMDRIRQSADQNQLSAELSMRRIGQLAEHIGVVRDLLRGIRKISRQSRMLALNASIEASRAGEAGESFAVVALETRRLSEEIDHSAQEITGLLEQMERTGDLTELAARENKEFAVSMVEMAQDISAIAWEQQQSTQQISDRVRHASASVADTVATSGESFEQAETLYGEAHKLNQLMGRFEVGLQG